jgi:radical SAM protein with 4Fe4S-binding SPASM domain
VLLVGGLADNVSPNWAIAHKYIRLSNGMNTNCVLPWMHTAIEPNGRVRPCCIADYNFTMGNLNETPLLKDIFTNNTYNDFRKRLLTSDTLPSECNKCAINEAAGLSSYRTRSNEKYKDFVETLEPNLSGEAEFKQLFIDYRFSNKCNFKCITCGPSLSSSHAVEHKKLYKISKNYSDIDLIGPSIIEVNSENFLEQFKTFSKDVREIYFAGGEPLMNDHHYDILNIFIETQQPVTIFYNTNFSTLNYQQYDLLDMWSKINGRVDLFISIDGVDEQGELIRSGIDLEKFAENVKRLRQAAIPNLKLNFSITYGLTNYRDVVKTTRWLDSLVDSDLNITIVYNPIIYRPAFSMLAMTKDQIDQALATVKQQFADWVAEDPNSNVAKSRLELADQLLLKFIAGAKASRYEDSVAVKDIQGAMNYMDSLDSLRKTNWKKTLSDMYNDWNEILRVNNA